MPPPAAYARRRPLPVQHTQCPNNASYTSRVVSNTSGIPPAGQHPQDYKHRMYGVYGVFSILLQKPRTAVESAWVAGVLHCVLSASRVTGMGSHCPARPTATDAVPLTNPNELQSRRSIYLGTLYSSITLLGWTPRHRTLSHLRFFLLSQLIEHFITQHAAEARPT